MPIKMRATTQREENGAKRQAGSIDRKAIITVRNNRRGQNSMHCHDCVVRDNPLFIEEVWSVLEARCETSEGRGHTCRQMTNSRRLVEVPHPLQTPERPACRNLGLARH